MGAVAGIVIDEGTDKYAYRQGLFVIGQTGEMVRILNDEKFKPKILVVTCIIRLSPLFLTIFSAITIAALH